MSRKILYIILLLGTSNFVFAQVTNEVGLLPRINLSYSIGQNLKLVHSVETRHFAYTDQQWDYSYRLTDMLTLLSYKVKPNASLNGGFTLRVDGDQLFYRLTQQYSTVKKYQGFRIGHRFTTDQTFGENSSTTFRFRYRIVYEKPLSGDQVDAKEFYFKGGSEILLGLSSDETDLEGRILLFLGYEIDYRSKIETGIDYRINRFIQENLRNRFMWGLTWYYTL